MNIAEMKALGMNAAQIAAMSAALTKAEEAKAARITVRASKKGAISIYGLGQFPVTLYPSQWARLLSADVLAEIRALVALAESDDTAFAALVAKAVAKAEAAEKAKAAKA